MSPLGWLGPTSPASTHSSSPRSSVTLTSEPRNADDEIVTSLAQSALHQVKSVALTAFLSGTWKECKATASELTYEQKTSSEFRIITKSLVPCTADEISSVLSSADSDQFNASMLELFGAQYAYGVTLRTMPTTEPTSHLSLKSISFASANPLSSAKRTIKFVDYVERDSEQRTVSRVVQTLSRTSDLDACDRQRVVGDALLGYILQEDPETKRTMIFFYATHTTRGGKPLRSDTVQRFRRMAQVTTKWVAIATRRRLGSHTILDRACDVAPGAQPHSCSVCAQTIGSALLAQRKKHFCSLCGHFVCGSCSRAEDVEERIGMVDKVRVCTDCSVRALKQAFERESLRWQEQQMVEELAAMCEDVPVLARASEGGCDAVDESDLDSSRPCYRPYLIV